MLYYLGPSCECMPGAALRTSATSSASPRITYATAAAVLTVTPNANPDPTPRLRPQSVGCVSPRGAQPRAAGRLQRRATVEKK